MTLTQLQEIRERAEKLPKEILSVDEWSANEYYITKLVEFAGEIDSESLGQFRSKADAEFYVRARQDIPDLLSHISALEAEIEKLREALRPFAKEALQKEPTFMRHDLNRALEVLEGRATLSMEQET